MHDIPNIFLGTASSTQSSRKRALSHYSAHSDIVIYHDGGGAIGYLTTKVREGKEPESVSERLQDLCCHIGRDTSTILQI